MEPAPVSDTLPGDRHFFRIAPHEQLFCGTRNADLFWMP
jgi:hypothetical protein